MNAATVDALARRAALRHRRAVLAALAGAVLTAVGSLGRGLAAGDGHDGGGRDGHGGGGGNDDDRERSRQEKEDCKKRARLCAEKTGNHCVQKYGHDPFKAADCATDFEVCCQHARRCHRNKAQACVQATFARYP